MPDSQQKYDRTFGQLEQKVDNLAANVERVLRGQEDAAKSSAIGRRRMHKRIDQLVAQVTVNSNKIETIQDTVEGHGSALMDLESFRVAHEANVAKERATIAANRKWLRWIGAAVTALLAAEGDHATGGKLLKWLASLGTGAATK